MSRIGKKPINIPNQVKVNIDKDIISVEGPKGKLQFRIPNYISLEVKDNQILVKRNKDDKIARSLHGLTRAIIFNMVKGVTEGYSKELEIVGLGFRAQVDKNKLVLNLGFSHPVEFDIPKNIQIQTPTQTKIVVTGIDKQLVGDTAARIRAIYPPEPYKGKGIRYVGEIVRKKVGKAAATTGK